MLNITSCGVYIISLAKIYPPLEVWLFFGGSESISISFYWQYDYYFRNFLQRSAFNIFMLKK